METSPTMRPTVRYETVAVDGLDIFYRAAGDPAHPAILLLHGFPSSSHMFRDLLPLLADHYRVVAPDLPGFGFSGAPAREKFAYTFDHLAEVMGAFTEAVGLARYALYVFDYGAPVGLRLALAHPERITALISQNGNAYEEGLSQGWNPIQRYWQEPTAQNRESLRLLLTPAATRGQYTHGVTDPALLAPEAPALDSALLARPGQDEVQLDLFGDYQRNVVLYPRFQEYFRTHRPPPWPCGANTTRSSCPPGRTPTGATTPPRRCICSTRAISPSKPTQLKSETSSTIF